MVAYACNPSYLGGRDLEDHGSRPVGAKAEMPISTNKPSAVHVCNSNYVRSHR
jgi:hypothetical protein